jgi:hypothetical protein
MRRLILATTALFLLCVSCAKNGPPASERPHATVVMRDGTRVTGNVVASSPAEVTIAGDDNVSRTIPMKQVKSIEYDDQPEAATASSQPPPQEPNTAPKAQTPRTSAAPPPSAAPRQERYHPPQAAIRTKTYVLPAGTETPVRLDETIDSKKATEGQVYPAEVTQDIVDEAGDVVIPRGSNAQVVIKSVSKGSRFHGASDLVLDLRSVTVEGQEYILDASELTRKGKDGVGANRRTAEYTGGGAAIGAIIGAIAGGGKGAAIGAGSGAGAGAVTQIITKGGSIKVPAETILTFKLDRPLRVVARQHEPRRER